MNEKKKHLLETAMTLFSEKGFHNTTIQEITQRSGISKGAFYSHFQSKEDITLSIFKHYYQCVMDELELVRHQVSEPTQSLAKQIEVFLNLLMENKEFIMMHMRENISLGEEVDTFIRQIKSQNFKWNSENLIAIYGKQLEPHIADAASILEGIINGYLKWIIIDNLTVDTARLAQFITRRVDDSIRGLLSENEAPQINLHQIVKHFPTQIRTEDEPLPAILKRIKNKIDNLPMTPNQHEDLHTTIDFLLDELQTESPRYILIKGLLTHFQDIPQMEDEYKAIMNHLKG